MRFILNGLGHTVHVAHNGVAGICSALTQVPDLILCDIQIPLLDGYQTLSKMRALPILVHVPVVAVTAHAMLGDRDRLIGAGFNAYLRKPFEIDQVAQLIRILIGMANIVHSEEQAACHAA